MCGIAGVIDYKQKFSPDYLVKYVKDMGDVIKHRGPDDHDTWQSDCKQVCFTHRRLSIIDLSEEARQPFSSSDLRYVITFNGEIYNHNELRETLKKQGITFRTTSDTEVLIESYRKWGKQCLEYFDGMFSFVIYDSHTKEVFAARDAFGEKPFYYAWVKGAFLFSSELHALTKFPDFNTQTNPDRVSEYLALQYIDSEKTFYTNASKLLPGSAIFINDKGIESTWRYFQFKPGSQISTKSENDLVDELEEILYTSIKRRLTADVPVGAFMSGGIDSALVVAMICKHFDASLNTFTTGFHNVNDSEHLLARDLAEKLQTHHHEQILHPEEVLKYNLVGKILDEPNADTSILPTYLLSQFARKTVKVVISGDGADELFGGYSRYWNTLNEIKAGLSRLTHGELYYSSRILVCPENILKSVMGHINHSTLLKLNTLRSEISDTVDSVFNSLRATDVGHYLPGAVLAKVDRMSMQHGLEVRTPYLNMELARFAEKIPEDMLVDEHGGKKLLKKLASRYLPDSWLKRKKMGFGIPQQGWAEQELKFGLKKQIKSLNKHNAWWLNKSSMENYLSDSDKNNLSISYQSWSILVLISYLKHHPYTPINEHTVFNTLGKVFSVKNKKVNVFSLTDLSVLKQLKADQHQFISPFSKPETDLEELCLSLKKKEDKSDKTFLIGENENVYSLMESTQNNNTQPVLYDGLKWTDSSFLNYPFKIDKPIFFSSEKKYIVNYPRIIDPLNTILQFPFFKPFYNFFKSRLKQDYMLEPVEFWRKDTPKRSIQLLVEFINYMKWRYIENKLLQDVLAWIKRDNKTIDNKNLKEDGALKHIVYIISSLSAGGAERQLRNLSVGLDKRLYKVTLVTMTDSTGRAGHYLPMFKDSGITIVNASEPLTGIDFFKHAEPDFLRFLASFSAMSLEISRYFWPLYTHLKFLKPDIVHCFLDYPNVLGGFSALAVKVPRIILSFRNSNPSHFFFHKDWYKRFYRVLIQSKRIMLSGNSISGNTDYADWLGINPDRIRLTRNGLDFKHLNKLSRTEINQLKKDFNITDPQTKVICGVFRLLPEKRPFYFLDTVAKLKSRFKNLVVILVGEGALQIPLKSKIHELNLNNTVVLAGRRTNVNEILSISDILLHTSYLEGTPNVILEAQYMGVPVVTTSGGGTTEAILHNKTGFVCNNNDQDGLVYSCVRLLKDDNLRYAFAKNGPEFVKKRYSMKKMIQVMESLYI